MKFTLALLLVVLGWRCPFMSWRCPWRNDAICSYCRAPCSCWLLIVSQRQQLMLRYKWGVAWCRAGLMHHAHTVGNSLKGAARPPDIANVVTWIMQVYTTVVFICSEHTPRDLPNALRHSAQDITRTMLFAAIAYAMQFSYYCQRLLQLISRSGFLPFCKKFW